MSSIEIRVHSTAPVDRVWALLVDCASWCRWAPFEEVAVESRGAAGDLRRCVSADVTTRELVTATERSRCYEYRHVSGLPVRRYRGEVVLVADDAGETDITWNARFVPLLADTEDVLRCVLEGVIARAATGLARAAEAGSTAVVSP